MDKRLYDYIEYAVNQARNAPERLTIETSPDELESTLTTLKTLASNDRLEYLVTSKRSKHEFRAYDFEPVWGTHWVVVVNATK